MRFISTIKAKFKFLLLIILFLSACSPVLPVAKVGSTAIVIPTIISVTATVTTTPTETPTGEPTNESTGVPVLNRALSIWVSPDLPESLLRQTKIPNDITRAASAENADIVLDAGQADNPTMIVAARAQWVYALVAQFKTVRDSVTLNELKKSWEGTPPEDFEAQPLLMEPGTHKNLEKIWGKSASGAVKELSQEALLKLAEAGQPAWAIIPFEYINSHWKVLRVDGRYPLTKKFSADGYSLTIPFVLTMNERASQVFQVNGWESKNFIPSTNRDPEKMTVLTLTGTTCMVRYLALKMEENGVRYPAQDIIATLKDTDILHISNEASFSMTCPPAVPLRREQRFCSDPKYLDLLTYIGTSVVELTGNHMLDWGNDPFEYTLNLYKANKILYYGGGFNQEEARKPLLFEDHGNRIALMGCSPAGPQGVWATNTQPGSAKCDYGYIQSQITDLHSKGYQVVFTFQHIELESYHPTSLQRVDFHKVADMGADIVSGSQAHYPQFMVFSGDSFIHYGLGNTFFDQMMEGNRKSFIDRHVFYNGRYIGTELVTVILEDYARLRLMTADERKFFLKDIFDASVGDRIFLNPPVSINGQ